ncbi:MAG: VanZ family protein [candidate division NC10 bacterium]|nr:VanZ family protein [candidate division NC10 bacterium]
MSFGKAPGSGWSLLLPISWMAVIYLLSGEAFASLHTSRFLIPLLHCLWPDLSHQALVQLHALLRKGGHFLEYLVLSGLWYWSLRPHFPTRNQASFLALALSLTYALFDEIHQSFLPSRTGSFLDILIDGTGALAMQAIVWFRPLRPQVAPAGGRTISHRRQRGA